MSEVHYVFVAQQPTPPQTVNHVLHLILTLVTAGFWVPIWLLVTINTAANNRIIRNKNAKTMKAALRAQPPTVSLSANTVHQVGLAAVTNAIAR